MSKIVNPKINRPNKATFKAFMGAFLLIACLPLAYWANYSYTLYQQSTERVRYLREHPEPFPTTNQRKEQDDRIALSTSMADRQQLEAFLSGTGAFVLFGIALLLFRSALRARKIKPQYEIIDWRIIPMPTNRIEVRQKRIYDVLFAFIIIFFGGMGLLVLLTNGIRNVSVILSVLILAFLTVFCYLMFRAKRQTVRLFDASGITRGDGRQFSWNDFCGVVTLIDFSYTLRQKYVWRIELAFQNGESAWIIPHRIKNADEVFNYIGALPRAFLKDC